jgi:beta-lactamase regulating signal transducer with metallopeptidase domain
LAPAELGAVLGHEWGHVCRRDPLRIALLQFWSTVLWFVPILRVLAHDSARAMEDAADDAAVFLTDQPLELAAALVKTAQAQARSSWSPVPAISGEHTVTARVERLLALEPAQPPRQHARTWVISAVVAICLLGLLSLPRQPGVAAMPVVPFVPQPAMMTCHMDTQQRE